MKVKTKIINPEIETPPLQYAKNGDAGIDLTATSKVYDEEGNIVYGTNRAFEIPEGYVGLLFPRSSNSRQDLLLSNSVGIIDSGYRGEVFFKFKPSSLICTNGYNYNGTVEKEFNPLKMYVGVSDPVDHRDYKVGDRIGQLIILPYPKIEFEEVSELSDSERGEKGFGSSGK